MRYLSICSGIEAATVAAEGLGWECKGFTEIEAFPSRVLEYHYPGIPNYGDFTKIERITVDLVVGGTPCQSFSVAGKRLGLDDARGNLAIEFLRLVARCNAKWFVWENVPGFLSSAGGRDMGAFVSLVRECGYSCAWRVLDAQYFGVPQRRRRIFVVGHRGNDWRAPAAVLFERESVQGYPAPGRKKGQCNTRAYPDIAGTVSSKRAKGSGGPAGDECYNLVAHTVAPGEGRHWDASKETYVIEGAYVRRLTPLECERLQGFPDNYTNIPGASDTARYKAIGNSMAVPVMRWIWKRIEMYESLQKLLEVA